MQESRRYAVGSKQCKAGDCIAGLRTVSRACRRTYNKALAINFILRINSMNCRIRRTVLFVAGCLFFALPLAAEDGHSASDSIESKYLKNIRQLTFDFTKAGEGYFSPDGNNIIFQAQPAEYMFYQIYTLPLESGQGAVGSGQEGVG